MANELIKRPDTTTAYVLWLIGFLGFFGLHRLYMGRWISGILYLFTGGLCFVGHIVDAFMMRRMIEDSANGQGW